MHNSFGHRLGGIASTPQFFIWRLQWEAAAGKYSKTPCAHDGSIYRIDASLPANWCDYTTAQAALAALPVTEELRYALGWWLTADSGYFFLDLDHASIDGKWSDFAVKLAETYPGAMVEASSSGDGLHVIGRYDQLPAHRNKPARDVATQLTPLQLELYTADRGICFGLTQQATGNADTRFTIAPLVDAYFPPRAVNDAAGTVRPEWRGPDDDEELIRRMLAARQSAAAAFGNKPSLPQLWRGDCEHNSEADMALASHAAWWTGCDEPRIDRIMRRSALVRDKWNERRPGGTYLTYTIANACAGTENVYQEQASKAPPSLPSTRVGTIRNAADLQQQTFQPIQWALQDLLPEGVTILSSDPKLGKSWMVYTWCIAIATGTPIWEGRASEKQGDALLLALEDNDRRMRRRLDKLLPTFGNPTINRLFYACDWPRGEEGVTAIREFLVAHPETRIVVVDTIAAFRTADPGRKNQYTWDYELGALLKPLSQQFQCAFVLVSHNRKAGSGDTHVNQQVSGTTGLTGGVDNVFVLNRSSGNVTAVLHTDGRDIEKQLELALQLHDGKWQFVGNASDVSRSQQRNSVLQAIASLKGFGTAKDIHEAMGATERLTTLRVRLSRMHKAGELELNGTIYTLVDPAAKFITPPMPGVMARVMTE